MGRFNMLLDLSMIVLPPPDYPCCRAVSTLVFLKITHGAFDDREMWTWRNLADELHIGTFVTVFLLTIIEGVRNYYWVQFKLRHVY